jgi:hypothetical protein
MAAPENKLSPSRTQGRAPSVQAETRSVQHSVVSIQRLIRLPLTGIRLRRRAANPGGAL